MLLHACIVLLYAGIMLLYAGLCMLFVRDAHGHILSAP